MFSSPRVVDDVWKGVSVPTEVAHRLISFPTSSAASEGIWSIFDFIHSKRRNRLSDEQMLVFVYANHVIVNGINKFHKVEWIMDRLP